MGLLFTVMVAPYRLHIDDDALTNYTSRVFLTFGYDKTDSKLRHAATAQWIVSNTCY